MGKRIVVVGWTKRLVDGWEDLVPPVKAPANWKDEGKIVAYLAEARANQVHRALDLPIATTLNAVTMFSRSKSQQFSDIFKDKYDETLHSYETSDPVAALDVLTECADIVAGLDVFELLSLLFREVARAGKLRPDHLWAKYSTVNRVSYLEKNGKLVLDPIETLMGSSSADNTAPDRVLKLFGLPSGGSSARASAIAAQALMDRIPL